MGRLPTCGSDKAESLLAWFLDLSRMSRLCNCSKTPTLQQANGREITPLNTQLMRLQFAEVI